jgi:hypothetical protein
MKLRARLRLNFDGEVKPRCTICPDTAPLAKRGVQQRLGTKLAGIDLLPKLCRPQEIAAIGKVKLLDAAAVPV